MNWTIKEFETVNRINSVSGAYEEVLPIDILRFHALSADEAPYMQTQKEHMHNFFELHFVLSGEMKYIANGTPITAKTGTYLIIPPEFPHLIANFSKDLLKCSVAFSLKSDEPMYSALYIKSGQTHSLCGEPERLLRSAAAEAERDTVYSQAVVRSTLCELIYRISETTEKKKKTVSADGYDMRLVKAKQFIEDNIHLFLSCEDIAAYCYLSAKQLNRIFLKHEGVTLLGYIHAKKTEEAKRLLADKQLSIKQTSVSLGFSSVYYFTRFFTRHTGMPPGEFKTNLSKK